MKLKSLIISILVGFSVACAAHAGTVTGTLQGPSGLEIKNATLQFDLRQAGLMVGTGSVVPVTASCYTSNDGTVVGLPNPLAMPVASVNLGSGSLPGGVYYVETSFYSVASGGITETLPSPELRIQLSSTGTLTVVPSIPFPANAAGMRVYIGNMSGNETLQGATTSGTAQFAQAGGLITGSNSPAVNSSLCNIAFNDTIIPYSGYNVSLISSGGDAYPGWPQAWQLNGGMNGTVNISEGAPLWDGVTVYPQPIVAQPLNNGPQSISGSLTFGGFNVTGIGAVGVRVYGQFPAAGAVDKGDSAVLVDDQLGGGGDGLVLCRRGEQGDSHRPTSRKRNGAEHLPNDELHGRHVGTNPFFRVCRQRDSAGRGPQVER